MMTQRHPSMLGQVNFIKSRAERIATSSGVFVKYRPRDRVTEGESGSRALLFSLQARRTMPTERDASWFYLANLDSMCDVQNIEAALKLRMSCTRESYGVTYMELPIAGTTKVIERRTWRDYDGEFFTTVYSAVIDIKGHDSTVSSQFMDSPWSTYWAGRDLPE